MSSRDPDGLGAKPEVVRWTLGCLLAAVSMVGLLILLLLIAVALSPPTWVQVLLGVGLALGGAAFAWLVASALGQRADEAAARPEPDRPGRTEASGN